MCRILNKTKEYSQRSEECSKRSFNKRNTKPSPGRIVLRRGAMRNATKRPEFEEIQEGFDYIEFLLDKP